MFKFTQSVTFQNITKLVSGTVLAQIIPILAIPILTRIYAPDAFGILSIFIALAGIIGISSSLRYEIAIPQAKDDANAKIIFNLCLMIIVSIAIISFLITLLANDHLYDAFNIDKSFSFGLFYLIGFCILFSGYIQLAISKAVRFSEFTTIAIGKISISTSYIFFQLIFGLIAMPLGLIFGYVIGQLVGAVYFFKKSISWTLFKFEKENFLQMRANAKEYKNLPIYSAPSSMVDNFSSQLPLLVVAASYDLVTVGLLGIAYRVTGIPISMVSLSISQIIFQKIASDEGRKPGYIKKILKQSILGLLLIIIPFALVIFFSGSALFAIVFGEEWGLAGTYAGIIVIGLVFQFIASPNSVVLSLKENIKLGAFWQILRLCTLSITLFFGIKQDFEIFLYFLVIHEICIYSIYLFLIYIGAGRRQKLD